VPTLVISPWAKQGFIDHTQYEFASLLRLAEVTFNVPTLGTRDVAANDMMNSFDFNQSPQATLIESANFVGPASSTSTTTTSVPEFNPTLTYLMLAGAVAMAGAVSAFLIGRKFGKTG
jgi:phospholipase C